MSTKTAEKLKPSMRNEGGEKLVTSNRKAYHDYHIEEQIEAGLQLTGTEIKSIRDGRVNLRDSYARIEGGALAVRHAHFTLRPSWQLL